MATDRPTLRIGNGAGFWGDNLDAPALLVETGRLDVLTLEYLAELTLAILAHSRSKNPNTGFVGDFPDLLDRIGPFLAESGGPKIVTNAGGLNPIACARKAGAALDRAGLGKWPIGVVVGDDVLDKIPGWIVEGVDLAHLETGDSILGVTDRLVSANAYLGAIPIGLCLWGGARVVITGRVADASLTVGPAMARFGWQPDEWDPLAGATVAGHLIECGAQATGGLWHKWEEMEDLAGVGYPIAEIESDGSSVLTKAEGSGGLVSVANLAEQIVYEIDDPTRYRTPDLDVDLTSVRLAQDGPDRVRVTGAAGQAPSGNYKIAAVYRDGWMASAMVAVVGRKAEAKARAAGRIVLDRVKRAGFVPAESLVECLGAGDVAPGVVRPESPPFEVVLRVTVRDPRKAAVERFCREIAPLVTAGPPGIAGYASGRPSPRPAFGYWPTVVDRSLVPAQALMKTASEWASEAIS